MEKEFLPYDLALRLKALGFDEPCLYGYDTFGTVISTSAKWENWNKSLQLTSAPLYHQAFRWFREKYGFDSSFEDDIVEDDSNEEIQMWDFFIFKTKQKSDNKVMTFCSNNFDTYIESYSREEAELACLKKIIEIVE